MPAYDAFISYSHLKDKPLAARLQSVIQTLGKPWYKRRSLRVFRDDTSLSATPHLWPSIEAALGQSRFLILLASREAAESKWVSKEVEYWLANKPPDTLLIAVTDGELSWQASAGDFDWSGTTPLPAVLKRHFASEPKWVDLSAYRGGALAGDAKFEELGADFAAYIKGVPKEDLLSEELRQQRKALTLAWSMVGLLVVLGGLAAWKWEAAAVAAREASEQRDLAEKRLTLANNTADDLVFHLAEKLRNMAGVPASMIDDILGRARKLQEQLTAGATQNDDLRHTQAGVLDSTVITRLAMNDTNGALEAALQALAINEAISASNPENAMWRRDVAVSHNKIGDVQFAKGDLKAALTSYRHGHAIIEALSATDPSNAGWLHDLSTSYEHVGNVLQAQDDLPAALKSYRDSLAIAKDLSASFPGKTEWRRDLSVCYGHVGEIQLKQNDLAAALNSFRDSLAISEALSASNPRNAQWRRDLSIDYEHVGRVQQAQGDLAAALKSYRDSLAIIVALSSSDLGNSVWRRHLSITHEHVAVVQVEQRNFAEALKSWRDSAAIREALVASDPGNAERRHELASTNERIGGTLEALNDAKGAAVAFELALSTYEALSRAQPDDGRWKLFSVVPHWHLAGLDASHARAHLETALSILEPLAATDHLDAQHRGWIGPIKADLAALDQPTPAASSGSGQK